MSIFQQHSKFSYPQSTSYSRTNAGNAVVYLHCCNYEDFSELHATFQDPSDDARNGESLFHLNSAWSKLHEFSVWIEFPDSGQSYTPGELVRVLRTIQMVYQPTLFCSLSFFLETFTGTAGRISCYQSRGEQISHDPTLQHV